jgi:hypothetical protein
MHLKQEIAHKAFYNKQRLKQGIQARKPKQNSQENLQKNLQGRVRVNAQRKVKLIN